MAEDGIGRNSPFAGALLGYIEQPGLEIDFLFRKVRDDVLAATDLRQEPFIYGSLPGEHIYLVPPVVADAEPAQPVPAVVADVPQDTDQVVWSLISESTDPAVFRQFIRQFPESSHLGAAAARLVDLTEPAAPPVAVPEPPPPVATPTSIPGPDVPDPRDIVIAAQQELRRAGCDPGAADGDWGPRSNAALARFAAATGLSLSGAPTPKMLAALKGRAGIICQPVAVAEAPADAPAAQAPTNYGGNSCALVAVSVTDIYVAKGEPWDTFPGHQLVDPSMTEHTTGARNICSNSTSCTLLVENAPALLSLTIVDDDDWDGDDPIGSGTCRVGTSCRLGLASVTVGRC